MADDSKVAPTLSGFKISYAWWKCVTCLMAGTVVDGQEIFEVNSRDINIALAAIPKLVENFDKIICLRFFDRMVGKIDKGGVLVDVESSTMLDLSPRFFLPGRGKIYTLKEVESRTDERSQALAEQMKMSNLTACFIAEIDSRKVFLDVHPERGDRILTESEVTDPRAGTLKVSEPDPVKEEDPGKDPKIWN